jgi:hypothetical protein
MPRTTGPFPVFFPEVVDQEQLLYEVHDKGIGNWLGVDVQPAQSFKLSGEKTVTALEFMPYGFFGTFSGDITVSVETDNSGSPSGTLANVNATKIIIPYIVPGIVKVPFDVPFVLSGATTYWINLRAPAQTVGNYMIFHTTALTSAYADESTKAYYMGTWNDVVGQTYFKVYVRR